MPPARDPASPLSISCPGPWIMAVTSEGRRAGHIRKRRMSTRERRRPRRGCGVGAEAQGSIGGCYRSTRVISYARCTNSARKLTLAVGAGEGRGKSPPALRVSPPPQRCMRTETVIPRPLISGGSHDGHQPCNERTLKLKMMHRYGRTDVNLTSKSALC